MAADPRFPTPLPGAPDSARLAHARVRAGSADARREAFCRAALEILERGSAADAERLRVQLRLPPGLPASELPAAVRAAAAKVESGAYRTLER